LEVVVDLRQEPFDPVRLGFVDPYLGLQYFIKQAAISPYRQTEVKIVLLASIGHLESGLPIVIKFFQATVTVASSLNTSAESNIDPCAVSALTLASDNACL
jgi:hypothetical protein